MGFTQKQQEINEQSNTTNKMHILEKWLLFVFCQKRGLKDHQNENNMAKDQLMEKQQQQHKQQHQQHKQQHQQQQLSSDILDCPCRRILLEGEEIGVGESWPKRPASYSPAQLEPISICADIHLQPDVVPDTRYASYTSSKRNSKSGLANDDDIEVLSPMATSEM